MKTQTPEQIAAEKVCIDANICISKYEKIESIIAEHATKPYREALEKQVKSTDALINAILERVNNSDKKINWVKLVNDCSDSLSAAESLLNNCPNS